MEAVFATHNGCIVNTGTTAPAPVRPRYDTAAPAADGETESGLGGQIGEVTAALNAVGWNHCQVPANERLARDEEMLVRHPAEGTGSSGLGGQLGELAAALNTVGWNHHKVPPEERR
jgi:hypothetical protein